LAAISCAGQLAWSGVAPWNTVFTAMTGVHLVIGVGEGLITGLVVAAVARARPELITPGTAPVSSPATLLGYGLLLTFGLAMFVAPFASPWPDGLEKVAETLGFAQRAVAEPVVVAPVPDYEVPGMASAALATALAGVFGAVVVFGLAWVLARVLVPRPATGPV